MPDAHGRFKGIVVPELPWKKSPTPVLKDGLAFRDKRTTLT